MVSEVRLRVRDMWETRQGIESDLEELTVFHHLKIIISADPRAFMRMAVRQSARGERGN